MSPAMIPLDEYKERQQAIASAPPASTRDEMIVRYLPLVRYVVQRLTFSLPPLLDTDDLLSYGTLGLINALDRFDAGRGVKFETYAVTRIRGYIIDQLRALDWQPRSARQRSRLIERTREALEHSLGRAPTAAEVATALGLPRAKYEQAVQDAACLTLSLDALAHPDAENPPAALLGMVRDAACPDPGAALEARDLHESVAGALDTLSAREQCVLRLYYFEERTLQEISRVLAVSESRACQIHTRALKRLRSLMAA